jgi:hypothetical protein
VIRTRTPLIVEDVRTLLPSNESQALPALSTLTVPVLAGDELLGTMTVAAESPGRFELADQRLLGVIAGQIGVAVQNARLHDFVRRGKRDWEQTFDAIADPIRGVRQHWRSAPRKQGTGRPSVARCHGPARRDLPGRRVLQWHRRRMCDRPGGGTRREPERW